MSGSGPAPKLHRSRRSSPGRGDWKAVSGTGWQGDLPTPPAGILEVSQATWETWFKAWWAAHWTTDDLPGLRLLIRIYDRVARGDVRRLGELRQLMDGYGITPKGQQDRRWLRPEPARQPNRWATEGDYPASIRERRAAGERRPDPRRILMALQSDRLHSRPTYQPEGDDDP